MLRSSFLLVLLLALSPSDSFTVLSNGRHGRLPPAAATACISFEYCTGCRWDLRSVWLAQELTQHAPNVNVTLVPSTEPGTLRIASGSGRKVVLFEKSKGSPFPEPTTAVLDHWIKEASAAASSSDDSVLADVPEPHVVFVFGPSDRLRAFYLAQEILRTFAGELRAVSLLLSTTTTSLCATIGDDMYEWGHPEDEAYASSTKSLKQWVRDRIEPDKDLGHSDNAATDTTVDVEEMDDDAAEEARKFFGVM